MYEMLKEFIKPELIVLVPVLYLIGMMLKKSQISDKYIPSYLGIVSIALSGLVVFSSVALTDWKEVFLGVFSCFTQGVLCAGASVYVNQLIKQNNKND